MFAGGGGMENIMSAFFNGGMGGDMLGGRSNRKRKGESIGIRYPVTLEDLYTGSTVEVPRDKTVLCRKCLGSGCNKPGTDTTCPDCRGNGVKITTSRSGNMIQQYQSACGKCVGRGYVIDSANCCNQCQGQRIERIDAPLKVVIERGMIDNDKIPFYGEGDVSPSIDVPGDLYVVLNTAKHPVFTRDGDDLLIKLDITLMEALGGFQKVITHLDGKKIVIRSETNQLIGPGDKKVVTGSGMPIKEDAYSNSKKRMSSNGYNNSQVTKFGDLIIEFNVIFPERLETSQVEDLKSLLPGETPPSLINSQTIPVYVNREPLDAIKKEVEQEDDTDEDTSGRSNLACATQ